MKLTAPLLLALALFTGGLRAEPITVVTEPWPPYVFLQDGQLRGADYEVSQQLLSGLGYQPEWRLMPWKRAQHDVLAGHADAILDIGINPERQTQYHYPGEPLSTSESVLFYRSSQPFPFTKLDDLRGRRIGVSAGYSYGNQAFLEADYLSREPCPSIEACLLMLQRGRIDMALINRSVGRYTLKLLGISDITHHTEPLSGGPVYLAFARRPELADLANRFADALRAFKQTANYQQILRTYGL
jgi:polar amino acid transport system substrate-binding protein